MPVDGDSAEQAPSTAPFPSEGSSDCPGCSAADHSASSDELSIVLFGLLAILGVVLAPPLCDWDGYIYHLHGLSPVEYLNGPHLLWLPFQWLLSRVFRWFHLSGTVPFQVVGILLTALACTLQFRLMATRKEHLALAFTAAVFIATSPWVWYLAPSNQPYSLLFLLTVLFLYVWRSAQRQLVTLIWLGCIVCLATLLQLAAILWVGAAGLLLLYFTPGSVWVRLRWSFLWCLGVCAAILAAYVLAVVLLELESFKDIYAWTTDNLTRLHGLAQDRWANLVKGGFGIAATFVQSEPLQDWLVERYTSDLISTGLAVTEVILIACGLLLLFFRRVRRWIVSWPWRNPLFAACLSLLFVWSVFCVVWEPINKFWAVCLFPFFQALILVCRNEPRWTRYGLIVVLILAIAWNLHADIAIDLRCAASFPTPQLDMIRSLVGPQDRLVMFYEGAGEDVDYGLLLTCLEWEERTNAESLADKYFVARPSDWEGALGQEIDEVLESGGRVFVSDQVFTPDAYDNMADEGQPPFSAYRVEAYAAIQGADLYKRVSLFFNAYKRRPSELKLGEDRFWVITGRKGPEQTTPAESLDSEDSQDSEDEQDSR